MKDSQIFFLNLHYRALIILVYLILTIQILTNQKYFEQFTERKRAKSVKEFTEALNLAIDRLQEGILLKDPDSVYKPNARIKGGWVKIKPEYNNEIMDMPDLVIIGGKCRRN